MSIGSALGNITSNVVNDLESILASAKSKLENIVGSVGTGLTNVWDGGFAGIDETNFHTLTEALNQYCVGIEELINGFNQRNKLEVAYKGAIQDAADEYVAAVKNILVAYVTRMRTNIAEAETAFANYKQGAAAIAQNVTSDAQSIRAEANEIKLD